MNKNEDWARLFRIGTRIVLFVLRYDANEDNYTITSSYMKDEIGAFVEMKMTFEVSEAEIEEIFDKGATEETAKKMLSNEGLRAWGL